MRLTTALVGSERLTLNPASPRGETRDMKHPHPAPASYRRQTLAATQRLFLQVAGAEPELGLHLHKWLEAHVLRREAEALIT
jgi:hypothetical protein